MSEFAQDKELISFIQENQEKVYRVAYSYVKNSDTAMDLVQDAIVKALQKSHLIRNREYLKTWFFRVLINECLMFLRRNKKIVYLDNIEEVGGEETEIAFESKLENGYEELYTAMDRLPTPLKTIVILRFFEDMKLEEVARITHTNLNTVKSRLYKALKILRTTMEVDFNG